MNSENQSVRDIMLPPSGFPCLKENSTVQEAIGQMRSFCPLGGAGPCGFSVLMVVDDQGRLVGRITQQGILKVLFSSLLETTDVKKFEGKKVEYSDLTTLLSGVMIKEGVNHLNASLTRVVEKGVRVLAPSADLIHAMSVMVMSGETVLPVVENDKLTGVVQLAEVFGAIGDKLIAMNSK